MIHKAYKFRVYPTTEQAALIGRTFGCVRCVWNLMLEDAKANYGRTKKFTYRTPAAFKPLHPYLATVDSMALCNAQMNLKQALSRFIKDRKKRGRKTGFPRWKSRHRSRHAYTTSRIGNNIRIEDGKLRLPKVGLLHVVFHRRVQGEIKSATVSQESTGKYFVSVLTEQPDPPTYEIDYNRVVGLDFSFHSLFVASSGARPKPPTWLLQQEKRLARAQRRLSRKTKGSNSYQKQKIKVARIYEHVRNKRKDTLYKLAKRILDRYDIVVVEDIDLVAMSRRGRRRRFGRSIYRLAYGILREILQQKATQRGKLIVTANRWFPSSQLCSCCGYRNHDVKDLLIRQWRCPECGTQHDRDTNAARNLALLYLHNYRTGAAPGSYAEGDDVSTRGLLALGKRHRGTRKSCGTDGSRKPLPLGRGS